MHNGGKINYRKEEFNKDLVHEIAAHEKESIFVPSPVNQDFQERPALTAKSESQSHLAQQAWSYPFITLDPERRWAGSMKKKEEINLLGFLL